jgi:hypothetical protein
MYVLIHPIYMQPDKDMGMYNKGIQVAGKARETEKQK